MLEPGRIYRRFTIASGKKATLRVLRWEDLDSLLTFINSLIEEKQAGPESTLYTGFDIKVTREEEAEWLAHSLVEIERGDVINVLAEIDGRIIANGDVTRGGYQDTMKHGRLGLTMTRDYRGQGIGQRMIETLVLESRRVGLRSLEVEFLADSEKTRRTYEKAGFSQAVIIPHKVFRGGRFFDGLIMSLEL